MAQTQLALFDDGRTQTHTSTFVKNMSLPVHRWFRYSAGFSAAWAESVIDEFQRRHDGMRVFDPFAGSGTTLLAADDVGVESYGTESHPFVARIARAKLSRHHDPDEYKEFATRVLKTARQRKRSEVEYPDLIRRCFSPENLDALDRLRCAYELAADESVASDSPG